MAQANITKNMPLSLISPVYNNVEELEGLLNSLREDFKRNSFLEMIVVDDCSRDDSAEKVTARFPSVKYMRLPQNKGAAAARNAGASAATHDVLVFIDSDVQVERDAIRKIEETMQDEKIMIMVGNKSKIPANKGVFPAYRAIMHNSWVPREKFATFFTGAFGIMRKKVFNDIGGFDEKYSGASVEDFEFGHRLSEKYPIYFFKDILIRVNWNLFPKTMKTHFHRTILWVQLFKRRKKFDNFCATPSQGVGYLLGFLSFLSFFFILLGIKFTVLPLGVTLVYLLFNRKFFLLTKRERGIVFMWVAVAIHLFESVVVASAAIIGLFTNPFKNQSPEPSKA